MSFWAPLRGARAAVVFLTRIPMGAFPYVAEEWQWAPAHFPLVGALLGGILGAVFKLLSPLGAPVAAVFTLATSLLLTGAFHEDGFADTSDALGGAFGRERGRGREKVFEILKDSRVGTYGACALIVSLGGRAALLARLGPDALWALPLVGCAARVGPIWQLVALPYVTPAAAARSSSVTRARPPQALVATAWLGVVVSVIGVVHPLAPLRIAALLVVTIAITGVTALTYARRVGGVTGDFLGATEQLCELGGFAALAWGLAA